MHKIYSYSNFEMNKFVVLALQGAVAFALTDYIGFDKPLEGKSYPGNDTYHDLVTLPPYEDLLEDPETIQALMESQGVTDIDYVEVTGPMSGGSIKDNYKGYIHWTDGSETKIVIKGDRPTALGSMKFRDCLCKLLRSIRVDRPSLHLWA